MKRNLLLCILSLTIASCSSFISDDVIDGNIAVDDKNVSDEILCLSAFTSEVKIPKSKIQQDIIDELLKRGITAEQCSSYVVKNAGGVDKFCSDFNYGYVTGDSSRMPSFGNYITLQDMLSVQKTLNIDCNTKQYVKEYTRTNSRPHYVAPVDFSKSWKEFQPKTNTVNCISFGSSTTCNDARGNLLNINTW
ncbi:hypothetical protein [Pasteurella multocida]|uniref:hypothetical protein n=1 Tax=Pasteurella multocida TaxID=747 RepID=UPI001898B848|nr:hypothetical protein [Pasteurella multocida]MBF6983906.1 hypothetical protein [Pasteurella multocida]MDA5608823.1 hypothetical protein [Pasteurella multocida subsp. multocida]MDA5616344.1 hypothetical protein [Pasteurella multocida]MDA5626363.1 hypothetical protein [Pasteurella multocida]